MLRVEFRHTGNIEEKNLNTGVYISNDLLNDGKSKAGQCPFELRCLHGDSARLEYLE